MSPVMFNIYVNDLISQLRNSNVGCYISCVFIGCIMYADDLILLSPSVAGMQHMLDVCTAYGHSHDIKFYAKKCMYMFVGNRCLPAKDVVLYIDNAAISYVSEFKYLGVSFIADKILDVDVSYMKCRFYSSCNSVLCTSKLFSYSLSSRIVCPI